METIGVRDLLNDEVKIIKETQVEQKFTGFKLFIDGKEVASYNLGTILKPVNEDDLKEIMEEKTAKIEEFEYGDVEDSTHYEIMKKCDQLTRAVNYLLEKESDK